MARDKGFGAFLAGLDLATRKACEELWRKLSKAITDLTALIALRSKVVHGTYTPTLTNVAIGTGGSAANGATYTVVGDEATGGYVEMEISGTIVLGTTSFSVSGAPLITIPSGFNIVTHTAETAHSLGQATLTVAGTVYRGVVYRNAANQLGIAVFNASATYLTASTVSATVPATWAAGNGIRWNAKFQAVRV